MVSSQCGLDVPCQGAEGVICNLSALWYETGEPQHCIMIMAWVHMGLRPHFKKVAIVIVCD